METLFQMAGVDPVKAAAIAGAAGWLTDILKIRLGVKGRGVQYLALFVCLALSVAWLVPWSTRPVGEALTRAIINAGLTGFAAILAGEARSIVKDKQIGNGGTDDEQTQ